MRRVVLRVFVNTDQLVVSFCNRWLYQYTTGTDLVVISVLIRQCASCHDVLGYTL